MSKDVWPLMPDTHRAIELLDSVIAQINSRLPQPELRDDWYQYPKDAQDACVVVVTRMVRIVSGLRAVKLLGEDGYLQEMGVVLRTVDDFCDEITFLVEGHSDGEPNSQASRFLEHFFAETLISHGSSENAGRGPNRVKRDKIRAAKSRFLQPENPSDVQRKVRKVDGAFDSYVHGGYPAVMELYEGRAGVFLTSGVSGSPNIAAMRRQLSHFVSRALAVTAFACFAMGFEDLGEEMKGVNGDFCASEEFAGRQ